MAPIDDLAHRLLDDVWTVCAYEDADAGQAERLRIAAVLLSEAADRLYLRAVDDPIPPGAGDTRRQSIAGLVSALLAFAEAPPLTRAAVNAELWRFAEAVLQMEQTRAIDACGIAR